MLQTLVLCEALIVREDENVQDHTLLKRIRTMRESGLAYGKIADVLNGEGIRGKNGGKWGAQTVKNVLEAA
jgi:phosphopentomutase